MANLVTGGIFKVGFTLQTESLWYAVLIDDKQTSYLPIVTTPVHNIFIDKLRSDELPDMGITTLGIFHFLNRSWKAHGVSVSRIVVEPDFDEDPYEGRLLCHTELYQSNEIGVLVSRIQMLLPDATVISAMQDAPFLICGTEDFPLAFSIDYDKVKNANIMASIRDDIVKMEAGKVP